MTMKKILRHLLTYILVYSLLLTPFIPFEVKASPSHPDPQQSVVTNIQNEISDADIAIIQYKAQLDASNKCRSQRDCNAAYKKASEDLAKAQNRKTNAQNILAEYTSTGLLPQDAEGVGNGTAHASDLGQAKASDYITESSSSASVKTTAQAKSTFSTTGVAANSNHQGLDPDKMNITTSSGFADMLVMAAIGQVARGLVLCTNAIMQAEIMVYVAGAVIYIFGEVAAYMAFNDAQKQLKQDLEEIKKTNGGQRESFVKMLQTLEKMKKTGETKQQMQTAAAVAFFAAAAIAAAKYGIIVAGRASCVATCSGVASATAATCAACAAIIGCPSAPPCALAALCQTAAAAATARSSFLLSNDFASIISSAKYASTQAVESAAIAAITPCPGCAGCSASFALEQTSWVLCPPVPIMVAKNESFKNWNKYLSKVQGQSLLKESFKSVDKLVLGKINEKIKKSSSKVLATCSSSHAPEEDFYDLKQKILNFLVPQAKAFGGPILGIGGVALSMITALYFTEWSVFDLWMHGPLGRSIVFALTGAFAMAEASATGDIVSKIEERIALVKTILAKMDEELVPGALSAIPVIPTATASLADSSTITRPLVPTEATIRTSIPFPCMLNSSDKAAKCLSIGGSLNSSSFGSNSNSSGSANDGSSKINSSSPKSGSNFLKGLFASGDVNSGQLSTISNSAANIADSIQGSDSLGMSQNNLDAVKTLASKLSFAQKALSDVENKINKNLKDSGKKTISYDSLRADAKAALERAALSAVKKQKMTLQQASAQFGTSLGALGIAGGAGQKANDASGNATATVPSFKWDEFGTKASSPKLNFDSQSSSLSEVLDMKLMENERKLDKDTMPSGTDIIDRPESSLFQVISVRYLKSGFKRLGIESSKKLKKESEKKTIDKK